MGRSQDVEEGGRLVVEVGETEIGIFRVDGELWAYVNRCPHAGGPVCQGKLLEGVEPILDHENRVVGNRFLTGDIRIICPWHGYEFRLRTGVHAGYDGYRLRRVDVAETHGDIMIVV